jgi:hypothetical protein
MFSRFRPIAWICLAAIPISIVIAVLYFSAGHLKHGLAFLGLAVAAGIGAWFATAPATDDAAPAPGEKAIR